MMAAAAVGLYYETCEPASCSASNSCGNSNSSHGNSNGHSNGNSSNKRMLAPQPTLVQRLSKIGLFPTCAHSCTTLRARRTSFRRP